MVEVVRYGGRVGQGFFVVGKGGNKVEVVLKGGLGVVLPGTVGRVGLGLSVVVVVVVEVTPSQSTCLTNIEYPTSLVRLLV